MSRLSMRMWATVTGALLSRGTGWGRNRLDGEQLLDRPDESSVGSWGSDVGGHLAEVLGGLVHRDGDAAGLQELHVVEAVAGGGHLRHRHAEASGQRRGRVPLVGPQVEQLDAVVH